MPGQRKTWGGGSAGQVDPLVLWCYVILGQRTEVLCSEMLMIPQELHEMMEKTQTALHLAVSSISWLMDNTQLRTRWKEM